MTSGVSVSLPFLCCCYVFLDFPTSLLLFVLGKALEWLLSCMGGLRHKLHLLWHHLSLSGGWEVKWALPSLQ